MLVSVWDAFPVTRVLTLMLVLLMLMLHCIGLPVSLLVLGIAIATSDVLSHGNDCLTVSVCLVPYCHADAYIDAVGAHGEATWYVQVCAVV